MQSGYFIRSLAYFSIFTASTSFTAYADGLADLKKALAQLEGNSPISATLESSFTEKRGKKKQQKTKTGQIQVNLANGHHGLQMAFNAETLTKLEQEAEQKEKDEDTNTPTLNAVNDIDVTEMNNMLSAAPNLLRFINKAQFINEQQINDLGHSLRQLNFDLPLAAVIENKEVHEYVDEFNGRYQITIDDNGVPIESKITFNGSGSAYIFFTMTLSQSNTSAYRLINDRLVNTEKTFHFERKSTWGKTESSGYKVLVVDQQQAIFASTN